MELESSIVAKIVKELKKRGGVVFKIHGSAIQTPGIPDLYYLEQGFNVWFEVKRPGDPHPVTKNQQYTIYKIDEQGGYVFVVHSKEEVQEALKGLGLTP